MGRPAQTGRLLPLVGLLLATLVVLPLTVHGDKKRRERKQTRPRTTSTSATRPGLPPGCAGTAPEARNERFESRVVELVNRERERAGVPPFRRVAALSDAARWFARDMASQDYFAEDHDTYRRSGGRLLRACDWSARLGFFYPEWSSLAENIAAGYPTPEETVSGWMGSASHRTKILAQGQWETGVGYWPGGSEGHYWVQDFGRRAGMLQDTQAVGVR